ncbi:hypothetical protein, partial [Klebsiella variicola]|uniref:hypothetical protein n=1 Tax=Klebsiella variicola TaxID=244366 RepID=UPI001953B611
SAKVRFIQQSLFVFKGGRISVLCRFGCRVLASNPGVVRIDKFERMKRKVERSADTKRVWRPFLISRFKLLVLVHAE